jgi:putative endonuclease
MSLTGRQARGAAAHRLGHRAETIAALWLRLKGYRILARRFRTPAGEIDLIVRRGKVLAFVEVKARARASDAAEAVNTKAQARIARAAEWYLSQRAQMANAPHKKAEMLRFDLVLVTPGQRPHHIPNAWERQP